MATAEIYIYRNCKIVEEKNFVVDDISSYLNVSGSSPFPATDRLHYDAAQYVKNGLTAEIKIPLDQSNLDLVNNNWNYCKVKNGSGWWYYFVKELEWTAQGTIKLALKLDVLNTYRDSYYLDKQTKIKRQHKDRFKLVHEKEAFVDVFSISKADCESVNILYPTTERYYKYEFQLTDSLGRTVTVDASTREAHTEAVATLSGTLCTVKVYKLGDHSVLPAFNYSLTITVNYSASVASKIVRHIDQVPEGINPLTFNKTGFVDLVNQDEAEDTNWYLGYKGTDVYLAQDKRMQVKITGSTEGRVLITTGDLADGYYYFLDFASTSTATPDPQFPTQFQPAVHIHDASDDDTNIYSGYYGKRGSNEAIAYGVFYWKQDGKVKVRWVSYRTSTKYSPKWSFLQIEGNYEYTQIYLHSAASTVAYKLAPYTEARSTIRNSTPVSILTAPVEGYNNSIFELGRSASDLRAILQLPYAPKMFKYEDPYYYAQDLNYDGNNHWLTIKENANTLLQSQLSFTVNPFSLVTESLTLNPRASDSRNDARESKIYSSEFYSPKVNYDSFEKEFRLEDVDHYAASGLQVEYSVSRNQTADMLFRFKNYTLNREVADYDNVLFVSVKNELTLYNDDYLNYIQNGYNFDRKAHTLQTIQQGINAGISTAQAAFDGYQKGGGWGALAQGVKQAAVSGLSITFDQLGYQNEMERKLHELKRTGFSVKACDTVDLMNQYAHNKLQYRVYEPSDEQKSNILNLFYYYGYNCGYQGVPDTTSRYWFNFIQCDPVIKIKTDVANHSYFIGKTVWNEITAKFNEGVTVLHHHSSWDFDQIKENWETWLLGA